MKKILLSMTVLFILFGCSNNEDVVDSPNENLSLEKEIADVLKKHDYLSENIVDYEIKGDFIYVFTSTTQSGLSVAILKKTTDSIEWIMDEKSIQTISLGDPDENTPVLTVVQTDDPEVTGVRVLDEHAKLIQLTQDLTDDYSTEVKYWIHFSDMTDDFANLENVPSETVEFIQ